MSKFLKASVLLALLVIGTTGYSPNGFALKQAGRDQKPDGTAVSSVKKIPYYGSDFFQIISSKPKKVDVKAEISLILNGAHVTDGSNMDIISEKCGSASRCYSHKPITYKQAQTFLMGKMYLVKNGNKYAVKDVYCEKEYTEDDFETSEVPGPNVVPDHSVINVEHTWPQSKFTSAFAKEIQKVDLHHLYPTDSKLNSIRGNYPFGEVVRSKKVLHCESGAMFGDPEQGPGPVFEPPAKHKGNVARALFYFSSKYHMAIDPAQEAALKKWHIEDPVDAEEMRRNEEIYKVQMSRNPFIDYPELASQISDF